LRFRDSWETFRRSRVGPIGLMILLVFVLMAVSGPIYVYIRGEEIYHPLKGVDPVIKGVSPPSIRHPLGTDHLGRDLLAQLMYGAQTSFLIGITAAAMAVFIGTSVGLTAGYFGGAIDNLLMRIVDIMMVLPGLPLIIITAAAIGKQSIWIIVFLIAILGWAGTARVIRSQTLSLRERPFVEAARVAGASDTRIIFKHIAPNVLPLTTLYLTLGIPGVIITEAAISFLGLGDPSKVSWGMMLQWAFTTGNTYNPYWLFPPGLCITLMALAFYLIGRGMEEIINPRLREI